MQVFYIYFEYTPVFALRHRRMIHSLPRQKILQIAEQLQRLEQETVKDLALKRSMLEKSEALEETKIDLGRQQERAQVIG